MIPVLFEIGPIKVYSYGVMLVVAFLVDYVLLRGELKRRGKDPGMAGDIVFWGAVGGIVGSRVYYLVENFGRFVKDPLGMIFSGAGLVFLGGLIGGLIAVTLLLKKRGERWLTMADTLAPLIMLGYAIGRVGCFLVGDDYGIPSRLPWAMAFPDGSPPTYVPVHPTQLYEIGLGLILFGVLWRLRTRVKPDGMLFFLYLILAGLERFFIEFIRTNPKYLFGLSGAQIISLAMILAGAAFIMKIRSAGTGRSAVEPGR
ncbi:MAG: prolipoprotein diacylglyceryl transferase [Fidelibacterota bacterium]